MAYHRSYNGSDNGLWIGIRGSLSYRLTPEYLQDAQKGCPARPQRAKRRGVRFGTLSL
jgi:hypothetical protein